MKKMILDRGAQKEMQVNPTGGNGKMPKSSFTIEVPKAIKGTRLEQKYLDAAKKTIHEQAVLRLFEQGEVSSGYAAELLGMTRYDFMTLLGKRGIAFFNYTEEQLREELEAAKTVVAESKGAEGKR